MGLKCEFLFRAEPNLGFSRNYFLTLTHWGQRRKLVNSPKTSEIQDWCIAECFLCSIKQLWEWLSLCLCSNNLENFYFNFLPEFLTQLLFMLHWYICCSTFQSSSITSNFAHLNLTESMFSMWQEIRLHFFSEIIEY